MAKVIYTSPGKETTADGVLQGNAFEILGSTFWKLDGYYVEGNKAPMIICVDVETNRVMYFDRTTHCIERSLTITIER